MTKKKDPKTDLISRVLKELEAPERFPVWIVILEVRKIALELKMVLVHVYDKDRLEYQASITTSIEDKDQRWTEHEVGACEFSVLTFAGREKKLFEKIRDFITRSFTEGKLQDFIPL